MTEPAVAAGSVRRPVADIVRDLLGNLDRMVRSEVRLAVEEAREDIGASRALATMLVAGAALGYLAIGFLFLAAFLVIETAVAPWLAALLVAVGAGSAAAGVILTGLDRIRRARVARAIEFEPRREHIR